VPGSRARDKELAAAFGRRLRAARTEAGLTQEQLAGRAELHATFIANIERGYSAPSLGTLIRLASALGLRPGELVDGLS
jgi:transcriptional regulator with XRE-family HTH domain